MNKEQINKISVKERAELFEKEVPEGSLLSKPKTKKITSPPKENKPLPLPRRRSSLVPLDTIQPTENVGSDIENSFEQYDKIEDNLSFNNDDIGKNIKQICKIVKFFKKSGVQKDLLIAKIKEKYSSNK